MLSISKKVQLLAIVPVVLVTLSLLLFSLIQTNKSTDVMASQFEAALMAQKKEELKNYIALAKSAVSTIGDGTIDTKQEKQDAFAVLRSLSFDDSGSRGYVFIYDLEGVNLMHGANQALEGRNLWDFKDPAGKLLIQELVSAAKKGGDFVTYRWKNADDSDTAPKLGYAEMMPGGKMMIGSGFWIDGIEKTVSAVEDEISSSFSEMIGTQAIGATIAALVVLAIGLMVVKSINAPVNTIIEAMDDIANGDGDLTKRLPVKGNTETDKLAAAFNAFADQARDIVLKVKESVATLKQANDDLSRVVTNIEAGVGRQLTETDSVATAMNEMAAAAQEVANNASSASDSARSADDLVSSANRGVQQTIRSIEDLSGKVQEGVTVMVTLGEGSEKIGSVLDVIRGIAEQTNLLALNAAIEAARAGEAGRGFSVVADEVRTLASKTQTSTEEIQSMIEQVQLGVNRAVSVIQGVSDQNNAVTEKAKDVGVTLGKTASAVATITEMNIQIASAAEEQTSVSEAINTSIHDIVDISEETAKGTKEVKQAANGLLTMTAALDKQIARYQV
ncbi:methyl-accepting chemotaxis protein [Alteromonas sp. CYL-A6]|uniref:methyl-accepting chemotaxis protein n=1 Tax=Alteromonas nitratireducens TaxID=3390813 RepID=UPI0034B7843F